MLFLDNGSHLIADELLAAGSVRQLTVYPRQILKRALELGACELILVHNHPCRTAKASDADIAFTRCFSATAKQLEVKLVDHIIVASDRWISLRLEGIL